MEHAVRPQILEHCKLSLPQGLKELMNDISREVLRAQPADLYGFIAGYLSALLVSRDNLSVAAYVLSHVCECDCRKELMCELRDIGLDEEDAEDAFKVIMKYFSKEIINEGTLLSTLTKKTYIDDSMLPPVVNAIRDAYLQHQAHNITKYEESSDSEEDDEVKRAASHTLKLYRSVRPPEILYEQMAEKIQASYRSFGVRRSDGSKDDQRRKSKKSVTLKEPDSNKSKVATEQSSFSDEEIAMTSSMLRTRLGTVSCTSLAGSFCHLPRLKPYSVHEIEEIAEREHSHIDYTAQEPHLSIIADEEIAQMTKDMPINFGERSEEESFHRAEIEQEHELIHEDVYEESVTEEPVIRESLHENSINDELFNEDINEELINDITVTEELYEEPMDETHSNLTHDVTATDKTSYSESVVLVEQYLSEDNQGDVTEVLEELNEGREILGEEIFERDIEFDDQSLNYVDVMKKEAESDDYGSVERVMSIHSLI
ncbi:uncharacterized protein LOC142979012 [Anticarsia gemmatalis]|uniref:uncharacterized protein LOC142979012 n=1 Tax=Anticarsia gemmatalis TaxID=129554 RepID=UPI003F76A0B5